MALYVNRFYLVLQRLKRNKLFRPAQVGRQLAAARRTAGNGAARSRRGRCAVAGAGCGAGLRQLPASSLLPSRDSSSTLLHPILAHSCSLLGWVLPPAAPSAS